MPFLRADRIVTFVQDNSSIHTARVVRAWFRDHREIHNLNWPAKSQDLNPIENVRGDMVKDAAYFRTRDRDEVFAKVKRIWDGYSTRPDYWRKLAYSMPCRLEAVIEAGGRWTKY